MKLNNIILELLFILIILTFPNYSFAQTEMEAWGNIRGIRVDGQLMTMNSSIQTVGENWDQRHKTAKERQQQSYAREGKKQISTITLGNLTIRQSVEDISAGEAVIHLALTSKSDTTLTGVFFGMDLSADDYTKEDIELSGQQPIESSLADTELIHSAVTGVNFVSDYSVINIEMASAVEFMSKFGQSEGKKTLQNYFVIAKGDIPKDTEYNLEMNVKVSGEQDQSLVTLSMDPAITGRVFDGIGGNFRLQNAETDPQVIDYCLENLRVSWGRVEMPWRFWHPDEDINPILSAEKDGLHPRVAAAMEMAQRLNKFGIPIILSDWSAPDWAIEGTQGFGPNPDGTRGNPLDQSKKNKIYESIADYIIYAMDYYGVEFDLFSFNESDLGIYVRQTPEEHAMLIKELGAVLKSRGLKTKLLLGDTADANGYEFINYAMLDPETYPYIGAISFHSWRGWSDETLTKWAAAADLLNLDGMMNVPLIVGEGSIDAAAWRYPEIFQEPLYAMEEINLYVRIMALCQPASILQWQLTADYSPLSGGGVFGNNEDPLQPTQRFWNLKQLGDIPPGLAALSITSDHPEVHCAALGNEDSDQYVVHIVNNGTGREIVLTGLPKKIKTLNVRVTSVDKNMSEEMDVTVTKRTARFTVDALSFTTLTAGESEDFVSR